MEYNTLSEQEFEELYDMFLSRPLTEDDYNRIYDNEINDIYIDDEGNIRAV